MPDRRPAFVLAAALLGAFALRAASAQTAGAPAPSPAPTPAPAAAPAPASEPPPSYSIWIADLTRDGDGWRLAAPRRLTDRDGYDNQPVFTADGDRILYASQHGEQTDVWQIDLASGVARAVTATAESEFSPTPYGDGSRFSVVRVEADGTQRLWSFAWPAGDDPRLLAPEARGVGYHAWLDDRRLALFVLGEPFTLRMLDLASGTSTIVAERIGRSLHRVPGSAAASFTAPDGDGEARALFAVEVDGSNRRRLAPAPPTVEGDFAWSPDGTLFASDGARLFRLRPGVDAAWIEVADLAAAGLGTVSRLAVSPRGDRIALVARR